MASEEIGYRGPTACAAAGITYRQLDYWARTGLVEPSVRPAYGSGTQRLYSFRDVVVLKIVKRFLDTGVSLQNIRSAVQHLRERGFRDLERMTLMSDGATVYECTSPDEVHALLQGGQGIFGIAVGVAGALGLTRFMQSLLFETTPNDPMVYGVVAVVMLFAAVLACWLPARRAAKSDPIVALRAE